MSIVKKKKHVSKKNKKAWRKYCDISDVEAFLEDQRLEERLGKFDTKPDSELFVVDIQGENEAIVADDVKPIILSTKQRKRQKLLEAPKCFDILVPSSKVEDPNKKRNHLNPVGFRPTALSKITEKRRVTKGIYEKKQVQVRTNRRIALAKKKKMKQSRQTFDSDLWGENLPAGKTMPETLCDDFIPVEAQLHNVLPDQRLRPKPPLPKTVITRAAVEVPHPGASYNPTYKDHQELLQNVVQHEEKMIKREKHLHRVTSGMFRKVTPKEKEEQWQEEMSTGIPQPHNPSNDPSDSDTDNEYKAVNPPVRNKKKDHKARRKQKERIAEREKIKREKIDKQKITDIYKLRKLESSISKSEQQQTDERSKRATKRANIDATAPPLLNANKLAKKEPDFVDPKHLSGDLRNIHSKPNLLRERYESLQRRGALAGAKLMMKKKRKLKSYFKPGHKVTDQDVEKYMTRAAGKKLP